MTTSTDTVTITIKPGTRDEFSPANIRPELYTYVGSYYVGNSDEIAGAYTEINRDTAAALHAMGFSDQFRTRCMHCGQRYAYGAAYVRMGTTGTPVLHVGHTCASETMSYPTKAALDLKKLTRRVAEAREANKLSQRVAMFIADRETRFPGLIAAFQVNHHIIGDIFGKLQRYGCISDAQAALVLKIASDVQTRASADAARKATAAPVVSGRYELTGTVVSMKDVTSDFGTVTKMLVQTPSGSRVWGTVPSNLTGLAKGHTVRFTASFESSPDDCTFGFYKRPSKAVMLDTDVVAQVPVASTPVESLVPTKIAGTFGPGSVTEPGNIAL